MLPPRGVFADASKVPRFVMTAGGDLKKETAEDRVALKSRTKGRSPSRPTAAS